MTMIARLFRLLCTLALLPLCALAWAQGSPPAKPSDDQVKKDVWGDGAGKLKLELTAKGGEFEWDARTRTWFFQRGFIVTRKGDLKDYPDADLEVGGLAVYRHTGSGWALQKLLTTFNRYKGIPSPSDDELVALAETNAAMVFRQQIRNMANGPGKVTVSKEVPVKWHNANSISAHLEVAYDWRVPSNGQVVPCVSLWEMRLYRNNPQSPWRDPVGMYRKAIDGCRA